MDNDYILLKLKQPLTFNSDVKPACLPETSFAPDTTGQTCFVSGWGTLSSGGSLPKDLQYVDVAMITNSQCNSKFNGGITDSMICAGYPSGGKDACQGDSGGPLVCEKDGKSVLVGVVSWGIGCAEAQYPGVYSRVTLTSVVSWIQSNMVILLLHISHFICTYFEINKILLKKTGR